MGNDEWWECEVLQDGWSEVSVAKISSKHKVKMTEAAGLQSLESLEYWLVGAEIQRCWNEEDEVLWGWDVDRIRNGLWYGITKNTERLTLKPEWMKYTNLQSTIYMG